MGENQEIEARQTRTEGVLVPVASPEALVGAMQQYQRLKVALLQHDVDTYTRDGIERIRKSGWRKLALAFGLSDELTDEWRDQDAEHKITWHMRVKVSTGMGRTSEGVGSANSHERATKGIVLTEHGTRALAHTRAKSRAIADLLGSGDIVAEEDLEPEAFPQAPQALQPEPMESPKTADVQQLMTIRKYLGEHLGPVADKLGIRLMGDEIVVMAGKPLTETETKDLTRGLWKLDFAVGEDNGKLRAVRPRPR